MHSDGSVSVFTGSSPSETLRVEKYTHQKLTSAKRKLRRKIAPSLSLTAREMPPVVQFPMPVSVLSSLLKQRFPLLLKSKKYFKQKTCNFYLSLSLCRTLLTNLDVSLADSKRELPNWISPPFRRTTHAFCVPMKDALPRYTGNFTLSRKYPVLKVAFFTPGQ